MYFVITRLFFFYGVSSANQCGKNGKKLVAGANVNTYVGVTF